MSRSRSTLVLALAMIAAAAACDDDDAITGTTLVSPVTSDANIVALTHESNLGEIAAGNVAT